MPDDRVGEPPQAVEHGEGRREHHGVVKVLRPDSGAGEPPVDLPLVLNLLNRGVHQRDQEVQEDDGGDDLGANFKRMLPSHMTIVFLMIFLPGTSRM